MSFLIQICILVHLTKIFLDTFPNSKIVTGKEAFFLQYSERKYQYAVLNYDKFSQEESPNLILRLGKQKVHFIILG